MRIYLAAPWAHRDQMSNIAAQFEAQGHTVTWKWWETPDIKEGTENSLELLREQAFNDKRGVEECQVLVLINSSKSEGKAVEQGLAISQRKVIIAVGQLGEHSLNVFHYLPNYQWVDDIEQAIEALAVLAWIYSLHESIYAS